MEGFYDRFAGFLKYYFYKCEADPTVIESCDALKVGVLANIVCLGLAFIITLVLVKSDEAKGYRADYRPIISEFRRNLGFNGSLASFCAVLSTLPFSNNVELSKTLVALMVWVIIMLLVILSHTLTTTKRQDNWVGKILSFCAMIVAFHFTWTGAYL